MAKRRAAAWTGGKISYNCQHNCTQVEVDAMHAVSYCRSRHATFELRNYSDALDMYDMLSGSALCRVFRGFTPSEHD